MSLKVKEKGKKLPILFMNNVEGKVLYSSLFSISLRAKYQKSQCELIEILPKNDIVKNVT